MVTSIVISALVSAAPIGEQAPSPHLFSPSRKIQCERALHEAYDLRMKISKLSPEALGQEEARVAALVPKLPLFQQLKFRFEQFRFRLKFQIWRTGAKNGQLVKKEFVEARKRVEQSLSQLLMQLEKRLNARIEKESQSPPGLKSFSGLTTPSDPSWAPVVQRIREQGASSGILTDSQREAIFSFVDRSTNRIEELNLLEIAKDPSEWKRFIYWVQKAGLDEGRLGPIVRSRLSHPETLEAGALAPIRKSVHQLLGFLVHRLHEDPQGFSFRTSAGAFVLGSPSVQLFARFTRHDQIRELTIRFLDRGGLEAQIPHETSSRSASSVGKSLERKAPPIIPANPSDGVASVSTNDDGKGESLGSLPDDSTDPIWQELVELEIEGLKAKLPSVIQSDFEKLLRKYVEQLTFLELTVQEAISRELLKSDEDWIRLLSILKAQVRRGADAFVGARVERALIEVQRKNEVESSSQGSPETSRLNGKGASELISGQVYELDVAQPVGGMSTLRIIFSKTALEQLQEKHQANGNLLSAMARGTSSRGAGWKAMRMARTAAGTPFRIKASGHTPFRWIVVLRSDGIMHILKRMHKDEIHDIDG